MSQPGSPRGRPRVSVVVPVRDRRELLLELLQSMARQTLVDHQLVVIDDGSTDGSGDVAREWASTDRRVVVVATQGDGAVAARRRGVAVAAADVLAFTDSDCKPAPQWLEAGVAAIDAGADVVQGRTEPVGPVRPLERSIWVTYEDGLYATCNVFYRREAFDAAGGFNPSDPRRLGFRPGRTLRDLGFGEDVLLGWRVRRRGRSSFVPEALVRHHVFPPDPVNHIRRAFNAGGFAVLVAEVPELRDVFLRSRLLLGRPTRLPVYAAAALGGAGARRGAAACVGAWVLAHVTVLHRMPGTTRRKIASLPVLLAADMVTAGSLLVGSARSRTVVL